MDHYPRHRRRRSQHGRSLGLLGVATLLMIAAGLDVYLAVAESELWPWLLALISWLAGMGFGWLAWNGYRRH